MVSFIFFFFNCFSIFIILVLISCFWLKHSFNCVKTWGLLKSSGWLLCSPWSDFKCGPRSDVFFTLISGLVVITFPRSFTLELESSWYSVSSRTGFHSKLDPVVSSRKSPSWGVVPVGGEGRWGWELALTRLCVPGERHCSVRGSEHFLRRPQHLCSGRLPEHQPIYQTRCSSAGPHTSTEKPRLPGPPPPPPLPSREEWHFVTRVTRQPLLPSREPKILASQSDSIFVCTHYTHPRCRNLHRFNQTLFLYNFNQFLL